jgi:hypothetical protein
MQIPKLNQMLTIINNEILDSPQHFTYIVIDDLDKQWVNDELVILLIKELFQAVLDMQKVNYLKIVVALRTNIFQQFSYEKQGKGGQEEKFRALSLDLKWTKSDLISLLDTRVETASSFFGVESVKKLVDLLPHVNKKTSNPTNYILEHTLMRQRDAIHFLNICVREATGKERVTWDNIKQAEKQYSRERLDALRDEWKDPYIGIEEVFEVFRECPPRMDIDRLTAFFDDVALLVGDESFPGHHWLRSRTEQIFYGTGKSWYEMYMPLLNLLFVIAFLGIARSNNGDAIFFYNDPDLINNIDFNSKTAFFDIHPAFRQALNIR